MRDTAVSTAPNHDITIIRRKALARELGISPVTLWRMRDELPPPIQISEGVTGWRRSDIAAWQDRRRARRARRA